MATSRSWITVALLTWPLTACDDDGPRTVAAVFQDDGTLCLLQEGGRARIYALREACGCSSIKTATCTTAVANDGVVVSSLTLIATTMGANIDCPAGCETRPALCSGELPGEGQYEVTYGSEKAVVELPLSGPLQIFERYPSSYCDNLVETLEANAAFERDAAPWHEREP